MIADSSHRGDALDHGAVARDQVSGLGHYPVTLAQLRSRHPPLATVDLPLVPWENPAKKAMV